MPPHFGTSTARLPRTTLRPSFTLIELLLVIGIIAVLAGIVIVAINPQKQLVSAQDAARKSMMKQLQNAFEQYNIDHGSYPYASQILQGGATPICAQGKTDATCIDLSTVSTYALAPAYIAVIPRDPSEANSNYSGYSVSNTNRKVTVTSLHLNQGGGSSLTASWLAGWNSRKRIVISGTNVTSALTNFPLYVKVSADADLASARADGYDIRFTASDGTTLYPYERESFRVTNGSGSADFWVKVPAIVPTAGTVLFLYYGNAGASTDWTATGSPTYAQQVWDGNFISVYHLKESGNGTTGEFKDSTAYAVNATGVSGYAPIQTTGRIGLGQQFVSQSISFSNSNVSTAAGSYHTVSFWMNWDGSAGVMPFGFYDYDLFLTGGQFGFNTFHADVYGTCTLGDRLPIAGRMDRLYAEAEKTGNQVAEFMPVGGVG
jgi:type IV pilus assembly protein PilA